MKNLTRQTNLIVILVFFLCTAFKGPLLSADADPFYMKLFQEGKTFYAEGKYREAVENFRIAEFGLLEQNEVLKELYLFYSLAHFKLGRPGFAREIIKKMETELNIKNLDADTLSIPRSIKIDVKVMRGTLRKNQGQGAQETDSWRKAYDFERQFWNTLQNLEDNKLDAVKKNIKKLAKIDKKDTRIHYIKGVVKFKEKRYKDCIDALNRVKPSSIESSLQDKFYYYLALSYLYLKNIEQARAYSREIGDEELSTEITGKIKEIAEKNTK